MWSRFQIREGWLSLLLLFLMLFTVTLSLQAADWAPGMGLLNAVFLLALLVGLLFAKSRLSGFLLHPLSLLIGASWIGYGSLRLVEKAPWENQAAEVIVRLLFWQDNLVNRVPSADTLPFVLIMGGLLWLIVYGAFWDFYRARNIWGVLIPGSVTILINTYYAREDITFLLIAYLIFAFLLVIRTNLLEQEERWRRSDIPFSSDIQFDFMREGTIFAVAVVALAWFMPNVISTSQFSPTLSFLGEPWG
nr:hypothetical protein [Ardenticatenales bacterium]